MTTAIRPTPTSDSRAYQRWVRRQKGYGRWQPMVDAAPVRAHMQAVMAAANIGGRRYADLAGVPRKTVNSILYGRQVARITTANATKLLALRADTAHGLTVPAAGTRRRLQVLAGEGWPQTHLAVLVGTNNRYIGQILARPRVTTATAEHVAAVYIELAGIDPLTRGVTEHGARLARGIAHRNQWKDRSYWDDVDRIDDPDFDPDAKTPRLEQIAQDAWWLLRAGETRAQIAVRLGISRDYVEKALREIPEEQVAA